MNLVFPINVFVYGTLKSRCSNHIKMQEADAQFLCKAKTKGKRLLTIKGLPFLHDGEFPDGFQVEVKSIKFLTPKDWNPSIGLKEMESFIKGNRIFLSIF